MSLHIIILVHLLEKEWLKTISKFIPTDYHRYGLEKASFESTIEGTDHCVLCIFVPGYRNDIITNISHSESKF